MNIMQRIMKQSGSAGEADHAYMPDLDWHLDVKVIVQVIRGNPWYARILQYHVPCRSK